MQAYSYRNDANVPKFDDSHPLVVFDGICNFCSRSMRVVFFHETQPIYFTATQSDLGQALLLHYGLDPKDPSSFLFLHNGKAKQSSDAIFALAGLLKNWPRLIGIFWIIPRPFTDFVYKIFARNRYKWFGKKTACLLPTPEMKLRMLGNV